MKAKVPVLAFLGFVAIGVGGSAVRVVPPVVEAQATRSVWEGVYTDAQAKRGDGVYQALCVNCHGVELEGGEMGTPLTGPAFAANWNGLTVGDLFERIRTTMPQDTPGKLTTAQTADVLAYLLKANRMPAGKAELVRRPEQLSMIKYEATKP
jgi:mono/diheme cytochrome c family protein